MDQSKSNYDREDTSDLVLSRLSDRIIDRLTERGLYFLIVYTIINTAVGVIWGPVA